MRFEPLRARFEPLVHLGTGLRSAFGELLDQEFGYSTGHLAAMLNTCLFAPSLLTFWFVNGVLDFSTAVAIGAVTSPGGLQVRLIAYLFLVPTFLVVRIAVHLLHPGHRRQVLSGSCPNTRLVSLDWFSTGILATGLPLALQDLGPWLAMNVVFLVGLFVVPRFVDDTRAGMVKLLAIAAGSLVFLYANYGGAVGLLPEPSTVLGPVATFRLGDEATRWLLRAFNSVLFGPILVGLFGGMMNRILTRPELSGIPLAEYALPARDPDSVVLTSAALGTAFYLVVVFLLTGRSTLIL
ncbi:hypothetical protein C475_19198 [Halosimplex carlsbadense 2-9-1]|uniref:Uncharacterized protein n=1 Tax=Halosimplex carlsbadense 2-9-1 TaxID=797114 RepID=M0CCW8_9EURY|nr:hypothetical protein [Halosimplex carlsbadense]ELZ21116.1 hypothetical protein C475_19198 [Halosimplex carlsbadense 2-9-1]